MDGFQCVLLLTFLQALWSSRAQGYALSPAHPTITAAPAQHFLLQKRQGVSDYVTCSQWTIPNMGQPICSPGLTCLFATLGGNEGCFPSTETEAAFVTQCYPYPTTWNGASTPVKDIFCPFSAPACGEYVFTNSDGAWTNLGCSSTSYAITAFQVAAFSNTPVSIASLTEISVPNESSTPTPTPAVTTPNSESSTASSTTLLTSSTTPTASSTTPSAPSMTTPPAPSPTGNSKISTAATIGGAVGGTIGGIGALIGGIATWYYLRKKHSLKKQQQAQQQAIAKGDGSADMGSPAAPPGGSPYC